MSDIIAVDLFINGSRQPGEAGEIELVNPASGAVIGSVASASERQLQEALAAAEAAFLVWSAMPALERSRILRSAASIIRDRADSLGKLMTREQGKPLAEARGEWLLTADGFDWAAEEARRTYGRVIPSRVPSTMQVVHKLPLGPVAAFAPWNFPAWSPTQKIAPALAAGCSMILKPATETPASSLAIAEILTEAGLPAGVLNVVTGRAPLISKTLIESPIIRKVSLTGSVEVGRTLAALSGQNLKKCTMELGGHAPVIVMDDADAVHVGAMAAAAKYRNAGQVCTSPTRFFLHADVYDRFRDSFVEAASAIKVGDGLANDTTMGPVVNEKQIATMLDLVADARKHGGKITIGGERIGNRGSFFEPTLIEEADDSSRVFNDEPFGPIAVFRRIVSVDEAIERANAVPYGLASYAFTHDARAQSAMTHGIETGMLAFNQFQAGAVEAPFSGVKDSGFGAEGGVEGIDGYLHTKFVSTAVA